MENRVHANVTLTAQVSGTFRGQSRQISAPPIVADKAMRIASCGAAALATVLTFALGGHRLRRYAREVVAPNIFDYFLSLPKAGDQCRRRKSGDEQAREPDGIATSAIPALKKSLADKRPDRLA